MRLVLVVQYAFTSLSNPASSLVVYVPSAARQAKGPDDPARIHLGARDRLLLCPTVTMKPNQVCIAINGLVWEPFSLCWIVYKVVIATETPGLNPSLVFVYHCSRHRLLHLEEPC